jgi:D-alanyl-D-alanine carboxypeptidase
LAEDGKLSLDDPLSRFIPEFPRANELTLRRMLNHTSGMGSMESYVTFVQALGTYEKFAQAMGTNDEETALLTAIAATKPILDSSPGRKWAYSNTAYALLGIVIARASGQRRHDFMRTHIFAPLGLTDTAIDASIEVVPRRVSGYGPEPKTLYGFENAPFIPMSFVGACGDMRSNVLDLCRWHGALLGEKLLQPHSLKEMLTPARLADGSLPDNLPREDDGRVGAYGFGLWLGRIRGRQKIAHGDSINGFSSMLYTLPDEAISVAYLVNCDDGGVEDSRLDKPLTEINSRLTELALSYR